MMASLDRGFNKIWIERGKASNDITRRLDVKPSARIQCVDLYIVASPFAQLTQKAFIHRQVRAEIVANRRMPLG